MHVRFAPSPTGYLHIGGARTALFNYLMARHHHGRFFLRIEDTDTGRSNQELTEAIVRSLGWLRLDWDEAIVYQSRNCRRHQEVCDRLRDAGAAYPCFCSAELLQSKRIEAQRNKADSKYDRACLSLSSAEIGRKIASGDAFALRFRVPEGETRFTDMIRGDVCVRHCEIEDFIIRRSDGSPTYQIAVVTDDHDMQITHVLRGEDHLSNTPKQIMIYRALGWPIPEFGHVPMILGPDKKRLSKRHGAASVETYRDAGILPDAFLNCLALLGWNPGDDREIFDRETLIRLFSPGRISKKAAVFDLQKLHWMNSQYLSALPDLQLAEMALACFKKEFPSLKIECDDVVQIVRLLKDRVKTVNEFVAQGAYFFVDPDTYEEKAVKKHIKPETPRRLQQAIERLSQTHIWNEDALESIIRSLADEMEMGAGKLIHPIRLAITGMGSSPGLFEVMALLGKKCVLGRIEKLLATLRAD